MLQASGHKLQERVGLYVVPPFKFDFIYGYTDGTDFYRAYGVQSIWRDHGYYKVVYEDNSVVVYARLSKNYRDEKQTFFYYSLSKDSPIFPLKRKYYDLDEERNVVRLQIAALKDELGFTNSDLALTPVDVQLGQKKKPDISARLQTTTRRPERKILINRSRWRKREQF